MPIGYLPVLSGHRQRLDSGPVAFYNGVPLHGAPRMDKPELLGNLNGLVVKYEQHRKYIEKARAQAAKFSSGVIEKVILDHEIKSVDVAEAVAPLLPGLRALVVELDADKAKIGSSKGTVDDQIQELELRQAIGEVEDAEFETLVSELRTNASSANERISAIDADLAQLNGALDRWIALAEPAGHYTAPVPAAAVVESEVDLSGEGGESYVGKIDFMEDMSSVFVESMPAPATVQMNDISDDIAIETADVGEDLGDVVGADVQVTPDVGAVATVADAAVGGNAAKAGPAIELSEPAPMPVDDGGQRRALLIYQESTAEEQIYPFTNDQLTIGRGRENDIQIKNDSKVSRYHCKLFRRGNNFYVEDIKSSNGTLVNGELITDRRLFGGEEIVVGETYFRFRIME